jgi:hypothetical protein
MGIDVDADAFTADIAELVDDIDDLQDRYTTTDSWLVGTAVSYAVYVNFGTRDQDPQPFFTSTIQEARQDLPGFIARNTQTTVAQIDSADELVRVTALAIERVAKQRAPVDTGTLRASIQAYPGGSTADLLAEADVDISDTDPTED